MTRSLLWCTELPVLYYMLLALRVAACLLVVMEHARLGPARASQQRALCVILCRRAGGLLAPRLGPSASLLAVQYVLLVAVAVKALAVI